MQLRKAVGCPNYLWTVNRIGAPLCRTVLESSMYLPAHGFESKQFYVITLHGNGNSCVTVDCNGRLMGGK